MAEPIDNVPTLEQLRTILAIGQEGSFSRAAAILNVRQPAITQQVRRLEEKYGRQLFMRGPEGVKFTVDGEALLIYARAMHKLGSDLSRHFNQGEEVEPIRIGINEDFGRTALPAVLGLFSRNHSAVQFDVICGQSDFLFEELDRERLDVVIARWYLRPDRGTPLWTQPTVWVGRPDTALPIVDPVRLILTPSGVLRTATLTALTNAGRSWRVCFETFSLAAAEAALQAGLGIAAFSQHLALLRLERLGESAGLPELPPSTFVFEQRQPGKSAAVDAFCGVLTEATRLSFATDLLSPDVASQDPS